MENGAMTHRLMQLAAGLLFLLMPGALCAQFAGPNVPMVASGQMPTAMPGNGISPTNLFTATVRLGATFDDKAILGVSKPRSDIRYDISPSLAFVQTLSRIDWGVSYGPGTDISQHGLFPVQLSQDFGGHFNWAVSKHGTLSAQENYILSTNPFQQFGVQPFTTTPGPIVAPNQTVYLPNFRRTSTLSQVQYNYQLSARTSIGVGGSFNLQRYNGTTNTGEQSTLIGSQAASGQANLAHQFTPRNELSLQYGWQQFKYGSARTTTHSVFLSDDIKINQSSSIRLYGGPQYSLTSNQVALNLLFAVVEIPIKRNTLSWSAGGVYTLRGPRGAMSLGYSRAVSDGGGIIGAVELNGGSANFSWKLTPKWSVNLGLSAADNRLLAVKTGENELLTYSAQLNLSRQIYKNVGVNLFFQRLNQTGGLAVLVSGNHDVAGVSLDFNFTKPVGR
jgi:hypothetical protein